MKDRSIQSRDRPRSGASFDRRTKSSSALRRSPTPFPAGASTATIGLSCAKVSADRSRVSSRTSRSRSRDTSADRVIAIRQLRTPSESRTATCSIVCWRQPSAAEMAKSTASSDVTPASMFDLNRTCPGTSMKEIRLPEGRYVHANPRSMVSPRWRSSTQRSGSVPVIARTSVDLPWSTCPAVATRPGRVSAGWLTPGEPLEL